MTRIAFVSDVHLGNHKRHGGEVVSGLNRRAREGLNVFATAIQQAEDKGCDAFVVSGDLFDTCKPEAQLIGEVQRILNSTHMQVILLLGNHEQNSTQPADHSLVPLRDQATVVDQRRAIDIGDVLLVALPFHPTQAEKYLTTAAMLALGHTDSRQLLVSAHVGISDAESQKFLVGSHDSIDELVFRKVLKEAGVAAAFVGNWHNHRFFNGDPPIYQTGALVPTGWDNKGTAYGMVEVFDSSRPARRECFEVAGPRFLQISTADEFDSAMEAARKYRVYLQAVAQPDEALVFQAMIDEARKENKIVSGEVVVDTKVARERAAMAAHVTRSASTLEEAVATFVKEMPLDSNVSRENIFSRLKGYLK